MSFKALNAALFEYGQKTLFYARGNLKLKGFSGKKRPTQNTGDLGKGLGFEIKEKDDKLILNFTTKEKYGIFIEWGVNGTKNNRGYDYSFKKKFVNIGAIKKYIKSPKFKLRKVFKNKFGQTVSQLVKKTEKNIDSAAFVIAKSIAEKGIRAVPAVQRGSERALKDEIPNLEKALAKDVKEIMIFNLKNAGIKAK
tara:strand:+ start:23931 stop:24515 length:585 start_codon:yes stop_codon:yes gene_type:complete